MSRCGYTDDYDSWAFIRWRGAVAAAIRGKRGQQFLIELRDALDAMPEKRLIANALEENGQYCAIGTVGAARGIDMSNIDIDDPGSVGNVFGISYALAAEIEYLNDEGGSYFTEETPERRWQRMREWIDRQILTPE